MERPAETPLNFADLRRDSFLIRGLSKRIYSTAPHPSAGSHCKDKNAALDSHPIGKLRLIA